ncbi:MAG TPA: hypothetical protein VKG25_15210 [Bryobacteraceae bacterium]|nr:hypothetical protein [Bryobacteraceae bacterium]
MGAEPDDIDDLRLDRTQFSVARLTDPDDSLEYWLSRPVEERLRALEFLRRTFYGPSASERIQRVLEVSKLERKQGG